MSEEMIRSRYAWDGVCPVCECAIASGQGFTNSDGELMHIECLLDQVEPLDQPAFDDQ